MAYLRFLFLFCTVVTPLFAQKNLNYTPSYLSTRPERTNYEETSRYDDVIRYIETLVPRNRTRLKATYFGYSTEGKKLPLVIWSKADDATPESVKYLVKKTRVLVLGNIHAGEVDGKEAILELLRDAANGVNSTWVDSLAVMFVPIYNIDGNDKIRLQNRPLQNGPFGGMGQRANAMDLDLNRDFTKVDAPETRALLKLIQAYDPHVLIDLHTTNGSVHAYHVTYAPPLHPNTDAQIDAFARNEFLLQVTRSLYDKNGWYSYFYGNLPDEENPATRGWYTFDHRPRFSTNYMGLRNRLGILSESYSYLPFQNRIKVSKAFVEECLSYIAQNGARIRDLLQQAEQSFAVGSLQALQAKVEQTYNSQEILLGEVLEEVNPYTGEPFWQRKDVVQRELMPIFQHFSPTHTEIVPFAYFIPKEESKAIERLKAHGIQVEVVDNEPQISVESFELASNSLSERSFQGHKAHTFQGHWGKPQEQILPKGTVMVRMQQPLARLAFALLEPMSDDGLFYWNFFDKSFESTQKIPVLRTMLSF